MVTARDYNKILLYIQKELGYSIIRSNYDILTNKKVGRHKPMDEVNLKLVIIMSKKMNKKTSDRHMKYSVDNT